MTEGLDLIGEHACASIGDDTTLMGFGVETRNKKLRDVRHEGWSAVSCSSILGADSTVRIVLVRALAWLAVIGQCWATLMLRYAASLWMKAGLCGQPWPAGPWPTWTKEPQALRHPDTESRCGRHSLVRRY